MQETLSDVVTVAEAAEIWGFTRQGLQSMCHRGDFDGAVRKSGGTWLILRSEMEARYGPPKNPEAARPRGEPVGDLLQAYGLRRVAEVLARREEFGTGELWREGRRWHTTREAMEQVFGGR